MNRTLLRLTCSLLCLFMGLATYSQAYFPLGQPEIGKEINKLVAFMQYTTYHPSTLDDLSDSTSATSRVLPSEVKDIGMALAAAYLDFSRGGQTTPDDLRAVFKLWGENIVNNFDPRIQAAFPSEYATAVQQIRDGLTGFANTVILKHNCPNGALDRAQGSDLEELAKGTLSILALGCTLLF